MNLIEDMVEKAQLVQRPAMKSGDTVRVHVKVREGDKERIQVFEGMVIGMHRGGIRASFSRCSGVSSFESRSPGTGRRGSRTTTPTATGPARQPRPTSSTPATRG